MTTRDHTAEALAAAACTNIRARARAGKPLPIADMTTAERLALQGIAVGEDAKNGARILRDAESGEPLARMTVWQANEFLAWAEGAAELAEGTVP